MPCTSELIVYRERRMGPKDRQPSDSAARLGTRAAAQAFLQLRYLPWLLVMAVFLFALFQSAWLCDDAFISFRTADNFIHGYGLTWNVQERVQTYTHPLWLFLFSAIYFVTREPFYTGIFLGMAVSAAAVGLFAWNIARSGAAAALGVLTLTASVAFVQLLDLRPGKPADSSHSGSIPVVVLDARCLPSRGGRRDR